MPLEGEVRFTRLIGALRYLDDSDLIRAWRTAIHIHASAQPGTRRVMATERLKACKLILKERFPLGELEEQA